MIVGSIGKRRFGGHDPDLRHKDAPTRRHSVARARAQGAEPWPLARDLIALFAVHHTVSAVARVCNKGRTSLRDYLLLRPDLRAKCFAAAEGKLDERHAVTVDQQRRRADRARRFVLRKQPEQAEYIAIIRRDPCSYCLRPMPPRDATRQQLMTLDHVHPRILGGDEHWTNYTGSCESCNLEKGGTPLLQFMLARVNA